jgi:hypothetical protein
VAGDAEQCDAAGHSLLERESQTETPTAIMTITTHNTITNMAPIPVND